MTNKLPRHAAVTLLVCLASVVATPQTANFSDLGYRPVAGFLTLPPEANFGEAAGVALNSKDHLFVFHRGPQPLMEFDADGKFIRSIGEGLFGSAHAVRIDTDDNIWTVDWQDHTVLKFDPNGRVLMVFGKRGEPGESDGLFNQPTDVAFGPSREIYISDGYGNSRVQKYSPEGKFLRAWGTKGTEPGQFNLPHAIAVDSEGLVYVGDRENSRIQIFDSDGNFLKQWTHVGHPYGLAITPDQLIYVAGGRDEQVLILDRNGKILGKFGERGRGRGQFGWPHGIAVGPHQEIYVAEILNWRVQKFVRD